MEYKPIYGKTYSLFGKNTASSNYYHHVEELTSSLLAKCPDERLLIDLILYKIKRRRIIKNVNPTSNEFSSAELILNEIIKNDLSEYTYNIKEHIKQLSVFKIMERSLFTSEEHYFLYMIGIELINRYSKNSFKEAKYRIALLPHCLRDLKKNCKSEIKGYDYVCKGCSKDCYLNAVSRLLRNYDIDPYIWKTADEKDLFKKVGKEHGSFGVLGIACIPELFAGMKRCLKHNIPVIGLPLDANRCIRWMGNFYDNSVNLEMLEKLVK